MLVRCSPQPSQLPGTWHSMLPSHIIKHIRHHNCPFQGQCRVEAAGSRHPSRLLLHAGGGGGGFSGHEQQQPFDERSRRALREAAEILQEAQELAQQQIRSELLSSWRLTPRATADQSAPFQPSSDVALQAFLVEQGLQKPQTEQLIKQLKSHTRFSRCLSTHVLQDKLSSLQRVLPGVAVAQLVTQEPELLLTSSEQLVTNMVALVRALPGCDVVEMLTSRPSLLLVKDMDDRLARILNKLVALHPSHSIEVVAGLVQENPVLVERMDYYLSDEVMMIDQLPMEIQNMMVLGDESGLGFLHKYWRGREQQQQQQQQADRQS